MMINKYLMLFISIIVIIGFVSAADLSGKTEVITSKEVLLKTGTTETSLTKVDFTDSKMNYTDKISGISVSTETKIDGVKLVVTPVVDEEGSIVYSEIGKNATTFKYNYFQNGTIKETVILQENKLLEFPVTLKQDTKIVSLNDGRFKIVSSLKNADTMSGVILQKPYGIDANGKYIDMYYNFNPLTNTFTLMYEEKITLYENINTVSTKINNVFKNTTTYTKSNYTIKYPLTIDPTWISTGGCWTATTSTGNIIIKYNTTGTTSWTAPSGVTSVWYLVVGGGSGSSGGSGTYFGAAGAGGLVNNGTLSVTPGNTYTVTVGTAGTGGTYITGGGGAGGSSVFSSVTSTAGSAVSNTSRTGASNALYSGALNNYNFSSGSGAGAGSSATTPLTHNTKPGCGVQSNITEINTIYGTGGVGFYSEFGTDSSSLASGGCNEGSPLSDSGYGGTSGLYWHNGYNGGTGVVILRYSGPTISNFTSNVTSGTIPFTVQFNDTSLGAPTTWQWTFGDGNTSSVKNATHTYVTSGLFNVTLTTNNTIGSNSITKTNYINASGGTPYAEFTANITTGTSPLSIQFTDQTNASATSWNWTFGDGVGGGSNYSNSQNPIKTFSGVGRYNVSLNVSSSSGSNVTTKAYYINVTAALSNPTSYINITPSPYPIYVTQDAVTQLNVRNITAKFIYANISFNKSEVTLMNVINNYSIVPGLTVSYTSSNTSGFVYINISNSTGGNITIGNTLTPLVDMRFKALSYSNGSAPLNFISANEKLTSGDIENVNTTVGGVIITADAYFTFNVRLINAATNTLINTLATVNASGVNITPTYIQTDTGTATFSANYSNVTFKVDVDAYYTLNQTVFINSNSDITLRLTPLTGPGQNTWYSPHQVRFTTYSKEYGTLLVGSTINITPLTNTFPIDGSADFLVNVYGLNAAAANDMMNGTLIMSGITGDDGSTTFTMLSSIGYNVNIVNTTLGINHNVKIFPIENDYNIMIDLRAAADTTMEDLNETQLTYTVPNASYGVFGLTYKDLAGTTSNVNFSVWNVDNNTMIYSTDLSGFGSDTVYANYTIPAISGEQYIWKYNASKAAHTIEYQRGATMKNFTLISLGIENIPGMTLTNAAKYYNWISMGFLFLIGAMSSKRMTRFFALLIPMFAGIFAYLGWLQGPSQVQTYSIIIMCGLIGAASYMKGSLRENYGSGGPGSLLLNLIFYIIILQTSVGIINATGIWINGAQTNFAATPTNYQMNSPNADLTSQIPTMSQSGGFYNPLNGVVGSVYEFGIGCIFMLLNILGSLVLFSFVLNSVFPFIGQSTLGVFFLAAMQIGIWFLYAIFLYEFSNKKQTTTDF